MGEQTYARGAADEQAYTELDGVGLAERVRAGEVSAAELLDVARARTDRLNPRSTRSPSGWTSAPSGRSPVSPESVPQAAGADVHFSRR